MLNGCSSAVSFSYTKWNWKWVRKMDGIFDGDCDAFMCENDSKIVEGKLEAKCPWWSRGLVLWCMIIVTATMSF